LLSDVPQPVDVERLVEELRAEAATRPLGGDDRPAVPSPGVTLRPHIGVAASRRRLVRIARSVLLRLLWPTLEDLARQTEAAVGAARDEGRADVQRLARRVAQLERQLGERETGSGSRGR